MPSMLWDTLNRKIIIGKGYLSRCWAGARGVSAEDQNESLHALYERRTAFLETVREKNERAQKLFASLIYQHTKNGEQHTQTWAKFFDALTLCAERSLAVADKFMDKEDVVTSLREIANRIETFKTWHQRQDPCVRTMMDQICGLTRVQKFTCYELYPAEGNGFVVSLNGKPATISRKEGVKLSFL